MKKVLLLLAMMLAQLPMLAQTKTVKDHLQVTLREDRQVLNDVVVIGYGTQKKATLTGAIDRMTLFNEKSMRSLTNPRLTYTDDRCNDKYQKYNFTDIKETAVTVK